MPYRRADAEYLREKAAAFRRLATGYDAKTAAQLVQMADELEAKAAEIEQRPDPRRPS